MAGQIVQESSFSIIYPKYRESYIEEIKELITEFVKQKGIVFEINKEECSLNVKTTAEMEDPSAILTARDLIKLVSRSVPFSQIFDEGYCSDILSIGGMVRNKERYVKRRQRLIGPNGNTLKALELLTQCYMLVHGNTVSLIGPYSGINKLRKVVLDCMKNVHPIYHIKDLMIRKELLDNDKLKDKDWSKFLPKFKKNNKRKKPTPKDKQTVKKEA